MWRSEKVGMKMNMCCRAEMKSDGAIQKRGILGTKAENTGDDFRLFQHEKSFFV